MHAAFAWLPGLCYHPTNACQADQASFPHKLLQGGHVSAQKKPGAQSVYQLKVTLMGIRPPIWRRIQVTGDTTLATMHRILQVVMGWTDSHLHQFVADGTYYGVPNLQDAYEVKSESRPRLGELVAAPKDGFRYEYDFGDNWQHEILLEKILPPEPGVRYPIALAGMRATPPEDVGGTFGYADFLEAIGDPNHPEHEELLEWVGGSFDPEAFELEEVNRALRRV